MDAPDLNGPEEAVDRTPRIGNCKPATQVALARHLGVSQQLISLWVQQGRISPKFCRRVHALTGVPLHRLNPEIYPAPGPEAAATAEDARA